MRLVVDANVVFAALLRDGETRRIILSGRVSLYAPLALFEEISEHLEMLLRKNPAICVYPVISRIRFVAVEPEPFLLDPDDAPYVTLARELECPLWTHDKALKGASVVVLSTAEVLSLTKR